MKFYIFCRRCSCNNWKISHLGNFEGGIYCPLGTSANNYRLDQQHVLPTFTFVQNFAIFFVRETQGVVAVVAKSHFAIVMGRNVHYARWATTVGLIYGSPRRCWRHKSVQKLLYFLALLNWLSLSNSRPKYVHRRLFVFPSTCTFSWEIPKTRYKCGFVV